MSIVEQRNLFINSEDPLVGSSLNLSLNLPQGVMTCNEDQSMKLVLNSFTMRKNWYSTNKYNNVFYIVAEKTDNTIVSAPVVIPEGSYPDFTTFTTAIEVVLKTALKAAPFNVPDATVNETVSYNTTTQKLTIQFTTQSSTFNSFKLVTFTMLGNRSTFLNTIIAGDEINAFQDCFDHLGGCKHTDLTTSDYAGLKEMFSSTSVGDTHTFTGYFMASLSTEELVYLRTNLNSTNFQTSGFDTYNDKFPAITNSTILAKIPIKDIIHYEDNGDKLFSINLLGKKISSLRLFITDSYGRLLPEVSQEQVKCSGISFACSLKVLVSS
jgi:hypothetical protein